ncbi:MAG: hypothetical protein KC609_20370 [Myxococcales bacterium]|nr:hypothetical protein [Myxococcales bacterium]
MKMKTAMAIATTAATLFASGLVATPTANAAAKVKCSGINGCKGKSMCKTAKSACKGHNACKGQGWVLVSKEECTKKGGKVVK